MKEPSKFSPQVQAAALTAAAHLLAHASPTPPPTFENMTAKDVQSHPWTQSRAILTASLAAAILENWDENAIPNKVVPVPPPPPAH